VPAKPPLTQQSEQRIWNHRALGVSFGKNLQLSEALCSTPRRLLSCCVTLGRSLSSHWFSWLWSHFCRKELALILGSVRLPEPNASGHTLVQTHGLGGGWCTDVWASGQLEV
jgi:hypothetical protein